MTDQAQESLKELSPLPMSSLQAEVVSEEVSPNDIIQKRDDSSWSELLSTSAPITRNLAKKFGGSGVFTASHFADMAQAEAGIDTDYHSEGRAWEPGELAERLSVKPAGVTVEGQTAWDDAKEAAYKRFAKKYSVPDSVMLDPAEIAPLMTMQDEVNLARTLGMSVQEYRKNATNGELLDIATSKLTRLTDQPWWKENQKFLKKVGWDERQTTATEEFSKSIDRENAGTNISLAYLTKFVGGILRATGRHEEAAEFDAGADRTIEMSKKKIAELAPSGNIPKFGEHPIDAVTDPKFWAVSGTQGLMSLARMAAVGAATRSPNLAAMSNSLAYAG